MQQINKRLEIVDILRGWAILVVVICNFTGFAYDSNGKTQGNIMINKILQTLEEIFFSGKGWTLLFLLFGFGFGHYLKNDRKFSDFIILKRMFVLFLFAIINSLIYDGDILRDYAFLGLIFILIYRLSTKNLIYIAVIMFLLIPFITAYVNKLDTSYVDTKIKILEHLRYSNLFLEVFEYNFWSSYYYEIINLGYSLTAHFVMFFCMIIGLILQKTNFFINLKNQYQNIKTIAISTFIFSILINLILFFSNKYKLQFLNYFSLYYWVVICTMLFTSSVICLLYLNKKCQTIFNSFSIIGKMSLSNYLFQNIIGLLIFQGIGLRLFHSMPYYFYFLLATLIYLIQVFVCKWWLKTYNYGPIEFIWRKLSNHQKTEILVLKRIDSNFLKE